MAIWFKKSDNNIQNLQPLNKAKLCIFFFQTPDEEFSPTRFNIYSLHQRGVTMRNKSESSYLVRGVGAGGVGVGGAVGEGGERIGV